MHLRRTQPCAAAAAAPLSSTHAPLLSNACTCSWQTFAHERPQHLLDQYHTMLDRTTKTGHKKPSPQKVKTKGTHLLKFLAFCLLENVGATPKMLGSIIVVRIPLDGQEPFHSTAEVRTALYGSAKEEEVPSFRRTAAGNVLEVYCESALMADDECVALRMMTNVTVRDFDDLIPGNYGRGLTIRGHEMEFKRSFDW